MIDIEKFICSLIHRSSGFCVIKVVDIIDALHYQGLDYKDGNIIRLSPESKESENERVRKRLLSSFKDIMADADEDELWYGLSYKDIIAWLEKQGEQKPADKVEPKFHEGDIIIHKELGGNFVHFPHKIIQVDILDKKYRLEGGFVAHFSEQEDYELVEHKPAWSQEDEAVLDALIRRLEGEDVYVSPHLAVKCLKSLKDRVQPKQEWGEEDEKLLHDLSDTYFYNDEDYPGETYKQMLKRVLDWMNKRAKSFRPQSTWKPSEEQMEALDDFIYAKYPNTEKHGAAVKSLYQDLKRL